MGLVIGAWLMLTEFSGNRELATSLRQDLHDNVVRSVRATIVTDEADEYLYAVNEKVGVQLYIDHDVVPPVFQLGEEYIV
jgi:hypothetical protein